MKWFAVVILVTVCAAAPNISANGSQANTVTLNVTAKEDPLEGATVKENPLEGTNALTVTDKGESLGIENTLNATAEQDQLDGAVSFNEPSQKDLIAGADEISETTPEDTLEQELQQYFGTDRIPPKYISDESDIEKFHNLGDQYYKALGVDMGLSINIPALIPVSIPPSFAFFAGGSRPVVSYYFDEAANILKDPKFVASRPTLIYIHGFLEGLTADSVKKVVEAYTRRNDHNIVVLDWAFQAKPAYFLNAVPQVFKVGEKAAQAVLDIINAGLNVTKLHIVGHSLGGQLAGVIGRTVKKLSKGLVTISRISALDPAYPGFYGKTDNPHLSADDADYVEVLHTDSGVYGADIKTGTVDFWPNGGVHPQPGCIVNVCSHRYSWMYWIESLNATAQVHFNAVEAHSWNDFKNNIVGKMDPLVVMGYYTPAGLKGNYYLRTRKDAPYALGNDGVIYKK